MESIMSKTRPNYPVEYREKILDLYRSGRNASSLSRDFEPSLATIRNWILQAESDGVIRRPGRCLNQLDFP